MFNPPPQGWWYVCRSEKSSDAGYVPATFLKKRPDDPRITEATEAEEEMLGFATSLALSLDEVDLELKYVAVDSYQSDDFRQLNFPEGAIIVVVEMTDDGEKVLDPSANTLTNSSHTGWWFATYKGMGGWVPASYLEPCKPPSAEEQEENLQLSSEPINSTITLFGVSIILQCPLRKRRRVMLPL